MKISKALRYTLILALLSLITVFSIIYVQRHIINTYEGNIPFVRLSEHVSNETSIAYLRLKELLAGKSNVNFEHEVDLRFSSAIKVLQGAYDGSETEQGIFVEPDDEETKALIKESIISLEKLAVLAKEVRDPQATGTSNQALSVHDRDKALEKNFNLFQRDIERIAFHINKKTHIDKRYLEILSWLCIFIVSVSFIVFIVLFYRRQRASDKIVKENRSRLEEEVKRVGTLSQFIEAVSAGNYDIELNSGGENDNLTATLIGMRDKLRQNAEDDYKRNWSTAGLAQVGEILRANTSSTEELYDNVIRFMVKYTKSNQGGLFILNDDNEHDPFLELVGCYAFERKKYVQKRVEIGDGLVGQCFLEGERIHLVEVPKEYISITSGLGGAIPDSLLIVPMKVNTKVYGVIELASFNKFQEFEIELIEKLAETIASTISAVRVNYTTRILLEKTQQQAEEMKSQEEEIRQNMEELEATQEEMRRKQTVLESELLQSQRQAEALQIQEKKLIESQDTLQAIVDNIPRAIFWKDRDLRFMGCNKIFAAIAGEESTQALIGKTDFDMAWSAQADAYRKDDMEVMREKKAKLDIEEVNINSEGEESWVLTSKVPILNTKQEVVAILGMFEDITARKRQEADISQKLKEREYALKELQDLKQKLESKK